MVNGGCVAAGNGGKGGANGVGSVNVGNGGRAPAQNAFPSCNGYGGSCKNNCDENDGNACDIYIKKENNLNECGNAGKSGILLYKYVNKIYFITLFMLKHMLY